MARSVDYKPGGVMDGKVKKSRLTKKAFVEMFGHDPVDLFGKDWRKVVRAFLDKVTV